MTQPPASPAPLTPPPTPPDRRGNGAAAASLVFGIFGCVPEVAGLLAILLGVIGLRRARQPNVGGKGVAAAGLALGIVSVVLWSVALAIAGLAWSDSAPARAVTRQYLADLSRRDVDAILRASTSSVTEPQVETLSNQFKGLGAFQDARFTGLYYNFGNGSWTLNGQAWYVHGTAFFNIRVIRQGDDWKVEAFHIRSPSLINRPADPGTLDV